MAKKITKDMKINEVMQTNEKAAEVLFGAGLMCVGCPLAMQETIEKGCLAHGMDAKKIDGIIEELNKK